LATAVIEIDIVSDTICPWCYVGKRRIERALAGFEADAVRIRWHPFQLNPGLPPEGMDRDEYVASKFGGADAARAVYDRIREAGAEEGIAFAFERMPRTPNTFASHRMVHFAAREGLQNEAVEALFRAVFVDGRDIGDFEALVDIGAECGIDPVALAEYLASIEDVDLLRAGEERSRRMGVTGVPFFIIGGRYAVTGAQDSAVLRGVIDTVAEESVA
jgi:predicted DsbA family dithiol-disulfide isomerase